MTSPTRPTMTDARLDRLVRQLLTERADDVAAAAISGDAMAERIATRQGPNAIGRSWILPAAAMLAALLLGGALAAGALLRQTTLLPAPLEVEWTGPIRPDAASMPSILMAGSGSAGYDWADGADAHVEWIDIGTVRTGGFTRLRWGLDLAAFPPPASTVDPTQRVIEYGVVLDGDDDGVPDCLIAINDDAPVHGDYRVWVTNLATGEKRQQVGPPYGSPIEFSYPDGRDRVLPPTMGFQFLDGPAPCVLPSSEPVRFYAWASLTESGRVTAWDYAPDAAWLEPSGARPGITSERQSAVPSTVPATTPEAHAAPNGEGVAGWPSTSRNRAGIYSWDGASCTTTTPYCVLGFMHNGYGSGDVEITINLAGPRPDAGGTAVTVAGHDGLYRLIDAHLEEWVVEIEGTPIAIRLRARPGASQADLDDAHAVIASMRTERRDDRLHFRVVFTLTTNEWDSG